VLHDINQACRYADHLAIMHSGKLVTDGAPEAVITAERVRQVFDVQVQILREPVAGTPMCVVERSTRGGAGAG
jgi:iron complex transport system ATP-binding protein